MRARGAWRQARKKEGRGFEPGPRRLGRDPSVLRCSSPPSSEQGWDAPCPPRPAPRRPVTFSLRRRQADGDRPLVAPACVRPARRRPSKSPEEPRRSWQLPAGLGSPRSVGAEDSAGRPQPRLPKLGCRRRRLPEHGGAGRSVCVRVYAAREGAAGVPRPDPPERGGAGVGARLVRRARLPARERPPWPLREGASEVPGGRGRGR